jgi:dTDP-4-amino-4,6-dideoxygalactose transaminase
MIDYLSLKAVTALHHDEIMQAMTEVADSGWYLLGERVAQFEKQYAAYIGTRHCISCANGLDALTLILRAYIELNMMREGDEVIVPANTYIASILSITENRLRPVLVEPRADTLQIDEQRIEAAITPRTRAVMIVHLYGRNAWTPAIADICRRHQLLLIEDNAQAHGCRVPSSALHHAADRTGSLGDAAAHSFYPGKNLGALGDGGAITTNDGELEKAVRALANYGSSEKYVFNYCGRNSRLDELQAAVLSVKLKYLDAENERRREVARYYMAHIHHPDIAFDVCQDHVNREPESVVREMITPDNVFHIFPIFSPHRDQLQQHLRKQGIGTMIHYPIPPHHQACYPDWHDLSLPITEEIHRTELSLPCNQTMTDEDVAAVCRSVNSFIP